MIAAAVFGLVVLPLATAAAILVYRTSAQNVKSAPGSALQEP